MSEQIKNKGWSVVFAGTGINMALGVLYVWSIFKVAIQGSIEQGTMGAFQWNPASVNDPYAVACLMFAFSMILAGRVQDRFGPRVTALLGGLLVGSGFILVSQTTSYVLWIAGFGVLVGSGIGFGYSAATPPALKWFGPAKTGLIAGIVVSGFGLASVYIAPLAQYMLEALGLHKSMLYFGLGFAVVVSLLSTMLKNPPAGYTPPKPVVKPGAKPAAKVVNVDMKPSEIIKTRIFWIMWAVFMVGAGVGLMVIGGVAGMAKASMGEMAFLAVVMLAVGNAAGRIIAGLLSDRFGRLQTLMGMLLLQSILMFLAIPVVSSGGAFLLVALATFIGFNYGTNLSLFPSISKDLWGLKNFGSNYGILFTSWGVGGFALGRLSEMLLVRTGSSTSSFVLAGTLLALASAVVLAVHMLQPREKEVLETAEATGRN